jgi:hypothetical protein
MLAKLTQSENFTNILWTEVFEQLFSTCVQRPHSEQKIVVVVDRWSLSEDHLC